jgi:hypothetical protein
VTRQKEKHYMTTSLKTRSRSAGLLNDYLELKLKGGNSVAETFLTGFSTPGLNELLLSLVDSTDDPSKSAADALLEGETALRMALHSFSYLRRGFEGYVDHREEMGE